MVPTIDETRRREMDGKGFTVFEDVFTLQEMEELAQTLVASDARRRAELEEMGGAEGISRAKEITFNSHLAENEPDVRAFALRPEFVALSTAFLGPDTDLYWNQTVFKQPEGEREFPWHQDDAYTPVEPTPYLTLWLAINDATLENGCISVLPGSHKGGLRPHSPSPIGLVGHSNDDPDQGVPAPIRAGSLIAFWSLTLHKSAPNRSKGVRQAYILQYCKKGLRRLSEEKPVEGMIAVARDGRAAA